MLTQTAPVDLAVENFGARREVSPLGAAEEERSLLIVSAMISTNARDARRSGMTASTRYRAFGRR